MALEPVNAFSISNKRIGDGEPVFIVMEAGPTHDGLDTAKRLVAEAAGAGADAVKFQMVDPDRLVADKTLMFSYRILVNRSTGDMESRSEPLYHILKQRTLTRDEWRELKAFCDDLGIAFFSTATFQDEVDFLVEMGCDSIKICSGDVDYYQLIEYCATKGLSIQLDTGNAVLGDVERAVDVVLGAGNNRIIIHNCPSGYPARLESINLRLIPTLKTVFGCPVAFSDHTPGWEMDIAAVALGADLVEKTITLDRTTPGVEHCFSLEPDDMKRFVQSIRSIETALGSRRKVMTTEEKHKAQAVRRSAVVSRDVSAGESVSMDCISFARPGYGIKPDSICHFLNRKFRRDIQAGSMISPHDID
jgi:N,N'-diacetyllegionaminate synthase